MTQEPDRILARLAHLERRVRVLQFGMAAVAAAALFGGMSSRPAGQQPVDALRVRQLIVEDADARARMVLGYLDAPGNRRRLGMRINDAEGVERFGVSFIRDNGNMVMGFDAPPGKGDDRNRERLNLVADGEGGAHIRFLDRRTSVASRLYLDEQNRVWMSFSDFTQTPARVRRYGLSGEEVVRQNP